MDLDGYIDKLNSFVAQIESSLGYEVEGETIKRSQPLFDWFLEFFSIPENEEILYKALQTQVMSGYNKDGKRVQGYSNRVYPNTGGVPYFEVKQDLFPYIDYAKPFKDMYNTNDWNVFNYYFSGDAVDSIFGISYDITGLYENSFRFTETLFAQYSMDSNSFMFRELENVDGSGFGLSRHAIDYLIEKFVKPYIIEENGEIKD